MECLVALAVALALAALLHFPPVAGCPFYTATPYAAYPSLTAGAAAACASGLPLHVCDGAVVPANESVPAIACQLVLVGDLTATGEPVILTFEAPPPAVALTLSGTAALTVDTLNVAAAGTLFALTGASTLTLARVGLWLADVAVDLDTTGGLVATYAQFADVGVAIYQRAASPVACTACTFAQPRVSAVSIAGATLSGVDITYSTWITDGAYINMQATTAATPVPYSLPTNWGRAHVNYRVLAYTPTCPSAAPAVGAAAPATSGSGCDNDSQFSTGQIVTIVIVALMLVVTIAIAVATRTTRPRTQAWEQAKDESRIE